MTDDRVETHVAIADPDSPSGRRVVHFQEYWVRLRAEVPAEALVFVGLDEASPGPGVIDAITDADLVVLPPSNPVVSVGTILGVPRVREALVATKAPVVGLSPIVGGTHVRGMAEQMLDRDRRRGQRRRGRAALRRPHRRRRARRLAGRRGRRRRVRRVETAGLACRAVPLMMTDLDATAAMAAAAVELVARDRDASSRSHAPDGVPEVRAGDDLAALLLAVGRASPTATSSR